MDLNKRNILFLGVCIPLRTSFVYLSYKLEDKYKKILGMIFGIIGITFLSLYFFNLRLDAPEGGGKTWWKELRLIHGVLYISAYIYSIKDINYMWQPILLDTLFGLVSFINQKIN